MLKCNGLKTIKIYYCFLLIFLSSYIFVFKCKTIPHNNAQLVTNQHFYSGSKYSLCFIKSCTLKIFIHSKQYQQVTWKCRLWIEFLRRSQKSVNLVFLAWVKNFPKRLINSMIVFKFRIYMHRWTVLSLQPTYLSTQIIMMKMKYGMSYLKKYKRKKPNLNIR